jgi:uncharacterized membrane protein
VVLVELPTLGGPWGAVNACTDGGDSAGWSNTPSGATHCAHWWASGEVHDCHPHHGTGESEAIALNNRGVIAGNALQYNRSFGYLWQFPWITWLMPLPGDNEAVVEALNENGETIGRSGLDRNYSPSCHAVGWEQQHPIDLLTRVMNPQGLTLRAAKAISDEGVIAAETTSGKVVLLTPIETPTSAWFAWKARIYNWYVQQWALHQRQR